MSNIRRIKRRIRVARNISQITRAMEMVAASKMKKAQEKALNGRPYAEKIYGITAELASKTKIDSQEFPLLRQNLVEKSLSIIISTNKGLCGGLNTNLIRAINSWFPVDSKTDFITFGKKAENFIVRTKRHLIADFSNSPFLENVTALTDLVVNGFIKGDYQDVSLIYNDFISILKQSPVNKIILPIGSVATTPQSEITFTSDFLIEPNISQALSSLLPHYLEVQIRTAILEAEASEHSARMMAMKAATDNALDLMQQLTLDYNKARQQVITYEIADIVTAREAIRN